MYIRGCKETRHSPSFTCFSEENFMSDNLRWRYGETNPVMAAVDSATVIEIGDLLYLDTDDAKPASAMPDQSSELNNQVMFALKFLGVAMQKSRAGDATPIRVATGGVFEFDAVANTFEIGDLLGAHEDSNGTQLKNQEVAKVGATDQAIGRCVKRSPTSATKVCVSVSSTVVAGGVMPST
jgi:hypothetical protein